jgi:hypothetical protein
VLGLPLVLGAQVLTLRGDADRAGVQVALADHRAARRHQRGRTEAEGLGAEQRRDDHVAAGLEPAVDAQQHALAQAVLDQHLLRLGEPELPGDAGVLHAGERRGAGAAVVTRHLDHVGVPLRDAGRDRADAGGRHQLHATRASALTRLRS